MKEQWSADSGQLSVNPTFFDLSSRRGQQNSWAASLQFTDQKFPTALPWQESIYVRMRSSNADSIRADGELSCPLTHLVL
jgi:hypothetical protein